MERAIDTLPIDGGWLALNFINTISHRTEDEENPFDYLSSYSVFISWAKRIKLLKHSYLEKLETRASKKPLDAAKSWIHVIEVRELLYRIFYAVHQSAEIDIKDQRKWNQWLKKAQNRQFMLFDDGPIIRWKLPENDLDGPLYIIIMSARDLLLSEKLGRVKECNSCGWLFLDQSKNKSRRWCRMETCGSQVKARNYYHRKKLAVTQ